MLLFLLAAHAADYSAADLLQGHIRGMPASMLTTIAGSTSSATAEEKACLLLSGVPTSIVKAMPGAAAATGADAPSTTSCATLGLDGRVLAAEAAAKRDEIKTAADAELEARRAIPECFVASGKDTESIEEAATKIQKWMARQVKEGRSNFVTIPYTSIVTISGTGGGTTTAVLCAWRTD